MIIVHFFSKNNFLVDKLNRWINNWINLKFKKVIIESKEAADLGIIPSKKRRGLAAILAFFFGYLGVHRFYVGRTGSGMAMILL